MVETRQDQIHALEQVIPKDLEVLDYDDFLLLVDEHGMQVAIVDFEPLQLEFEISVVLMDENQEIEEQCVEAQEVVDDVFEKTFKPKGFSLAREGRLVEGEALDDPSISIWSWEHTVYVRPKSYEELAELLRWGMDQEDDFVLA